MSDVGRYRKVFTSIWIDPRFRELRESTRMLVFYLLSGPQTNRIGLYRFSVGTAAEDLGVSVETIRKGLADVTEMFGWLHDAGARVFYIRPSEPERSQRQPQGLERDSSVRAR